MDNGDSTRTTPEIAANGGLASAGCCRARKAAIAEFRRRCEECRQLAMDATPMGEGRARLERELQGKQ